MKSRMDKYYTKEPKKFERLKKNTQLYDEVYEDVYKDTSYKNMQIIDSAKEINLGKLKNILDDNYDTRRYRTLDNYSTEDVEDIDKLKIDDRENRSYDINEVLREAKNKRTFMEETREKNKILDLEDINSYNSDFDNIKKEEKELEDLINTIAMEKVSVDDTDDALDLLSDLKGEDNTIVTNPINTTFELGSVNDDVPKNETNNTDITTDTTFYTNSNMFTKNDFEDFSTLTNELSSKSKTKRIVIIIIIILLLIAVGCFAYFNYFNK